MVDSLLRLYNLNENQVFIDDIDIMKIKLKSLRKAIAYVPQDNFLFSDTIANNISFSEDDCDLDKIQNAAILADVDENISEFPEKYQTVLGEDNNGFRWSKTRISIARAMKKQNLILDDSVAVDTNREKILHNLRKTRKAKPLFSLLIEYRRFRP